MKSWVLALSIVAVGCSSSSSGPSTPAADSGTPGDSGGGTDSGGEVDAGTDTGGGDGGKLPFGAACTTSDQCVGGACISFPAKGGNLCTEPCPANTADCPNGGIGCNMQGYCKVP